MHASREWVFQDGSRIELEFANAYRTGSKLCRLVEAIRKCRVEVGRAGIDSDPDARSIHSEDYFRHIFRKERLFLASIKIRPLDAFRKTSA